MDENRTQKGQKVGEKDEIELWSGATSLFDVRCSMFDVGRSFFSR